MRYSIPATVCVQFLSPVSTFFYKPRTFTPKMSTDDKNSEKKLISHFIALTSVLSMYVSWTVSFRGIGISEKY